MYTCFVYLQPFYVTLDFKLFIDSINNLFLLYLLLWFWEFTNKNLQDFIKIYRALIKDIFPEYSLDSVYVLGYWVVTTWIVKFGFSRAQQGFGQEITRR